MWTLTYVPLKAKAGKWVSSIPVFPIPEYGCPVFQYFQYFSQALEFPAITNWELETPNRKLIWQNQTAALQALR